MELNTIERINNICNIDRNLELYFLLRLNDFSNNLYDEWENDDDMLEYIEKINITGIEYDNGKGAFSTLRRLLGFSSDDDVVSDIFDKYREIPIEQRMVLLKKELIEWAIELEESGEAGYEEV